MCHHQNPMTNVYNIVTQGWLKVQYNYGVTVTKYTAPVDEAVTKLLRGSRCYNVIVVFSK